MRVGDHRLNLPVLLAPITGVAGRPFRARVRVGAGPAGAAGLPGAPDGAMAEAA